MTTRFRQSNGMTVDVDEARSKRIAAALRYEANRRARVLVSREGNRTTARRAPIKPASDKRRAENRQRRINVEAAFGTEPLCHYPDCNRYANDAHEVLSRARGGSITDPTNIRPLCRTHHDRITTHPLEAAALGLSISAFGGAA